MKKLQIQFILSCIFTLVICETAFSANEYFRSIATGNWNSTSTWEMSLNNSTWTPATSTPDATSNLITVRSPNTVTVTANVSADQFTVDNGATLSVNPGITLTILAGAGNDMTLNAGGTVSGTGTIQTQGDLLFNIRGGSNFLAALKINTGTATVTDLGTPYDADLFGNITIDTNGILNTNNTANYDLSVYGSITNNGIITGTGGSQLSFFGPALINNGSITAAVFNFDSTTAVSGSGTYTGAKIYVDPTGNISLLNDVTFSPSSELLFYGGGIFSANTHILTVSSGLFSVNSGATVANSGLIRMQGGAGLNPRGGSNFNADLNIASGTTQVSDLGSPYKASLFGNVSVSNGATLFTDNTASYTLSVYGNLTNNGTISGIGSSLRFFGAALINTGSIVSPNFYFDSVSTVSGAGSYSGIKIYIGANGIVSLLNDVTFSPTSEFLINNGGTFSANTKILTVNSGLFTINSGGIVANSGLIRMSDGAGLNPRGGSNFNADLNIFSGTTEISDLGSPYKARLNGNVTVNSGSTLFTDNTESYTLSIYGNLTNNGTISGIGSTLRFFGAALINTGAIISPHFYFDSVSTISGTGSFTGKNIYVGGNGNVSLLNDVTFSPVTEFLMLTGGNFSANTHTLIFNSGLFTVNTGANVVNSGLIRMENGADINPRSGSTFNADIRIANGNTQISDLGTPYNARLYGNITIDIGATLFTDNSESYTLFIFGNILNNGTIAGVGDLEIQSGAHTIQGIGEWTTDLFILSGGNVTLLSNHMFYAVDIRAGGTFDISNRLVGFTASNPITQNGTFTTTNSDIVYNGTSLQSISTVNVTYVGLKINNPAGATLTNSITIPDTLAVILGDLNLNGKIITITPAGYMTETPGNTVYGTSGYITTTRTVGTPTALNVAGMGAVITASTNLGSTVINRGHTVQTGLNGGTSIKRYYDITPTNNSGLNATLVFKFDDSELNGKPEPSLKLFKSTNTGSTWLYQGGTVNIAASQITLSGLTSFSRWSADSSKVSAAIGLIMEGFYNTGTNNLNITDTVRAYLRNISSPYAVVDSAISLLDSLTFRSALQFTNASTGSYYIQLKHRNSLETWSKNPVNYIQDSTLNYDFTFAATQAFGNNEVLKGTKYCLYSGDVTQDGNIDLNDVLLIYNSSSSFATGYVNTDVNGNSIVDLTDILIASNNATKFISRKSPLNP